MELTETVIPTRCAQNLVSVSQKYRVRSSLCSYKVLTKMLSPLLELLQQEGDLPLFTCVCSECYSRLQGSSIPVVSKYTVKEVCSRL